MSKWRKSDRRQPTLKIGTFQVRGRRKQKLSAIKRIEPKNMELLGPQGKLSSSSHCMKIWRELIQSGTFTNEFTVMKNDFRHLAVLSQCFFSGEDFKAFWLTSNKINMLKWKSILSRIFLHA